MSHRTLIFREPSTKLTIHDEYISVKNICIDYIVSFSHIKAIYLSKSIKTDINQCYKISNKVPLFIIDQNGYILAELKSLKNA